MNEKLQDGLREKVHFIADKLEFLVSGVSDHGMPFTTYTILQRKIKLLKAYILY